jgi:uncharacterized protein YdeI (YjbR/CyaY-like superfamily)
MTAPTNIKFFKTSADLRKWFEKNHQTAKEQWVGYYKAGSGKQSITWSESVDQALCFGWIDGVRKSLDEKRYTIRFTPRNPNSIWSDINIKKIAELKRLGLMTPAGLKVFEQRDSAKSRQYSFEQRKNPKLPAADTKKFKANNRAWKYFLSQPPWYQKAAVWWVISAKKEETRLKRLAQLIKDCEHGRTIPVLTRKK